VDDVAGGVDQQRVYRVVDVDLRVGLRQGVIQLRSDVLDALTHCSKPSSCRLGSLFRAEPFPQCLFVGFEVSRLRTDDAFVEDGRAGLP
jgi:hypothetical protein